MPARSRRDKPLAAGANVGSDQAFRADAGLTSNTVNVRLTEPAYRH